MRKTVDLHSKATDEQIAEAIARTHRMKKQSAQMDACAVQVWNAMNESLQKAGFAYSQGVIRNAFKDKP